MQRRSNALPILLLCGVAGSAAAGCTREPEQTAEQPAPEAAATTQSPAKITYTSTGALQRPEGYRQWVYVGTPITPNELNPPEAPFPDFHIVYIHPDDYVAYQRTGAFPEGTVLIKELVSIGSKKAASGNGYFMGDYIGLEATVKDSSRYPNEPGHWAYFTFGHKYPLADTTRAQSTETCNACHQESAAEDFVFTQYYPVLRAAKGTGN